MTDFLDDDDGELLAIFVEEALEGLVATEPLLVTLEQHPDDDEAVAALFRHLHSLKGNASFFGLDEVKTLAHDLEDALDAVCKGEASVTAELIDVLLDGTDLLRQMVERVGAGEPPCANLAEFQAFIARVADASAHSRALDDGELLAQAFDHLIDFLRLEQGALSSKARMALDQALDVRARMAQAASRPADSVEGDRHEGAAAADAAAASGAGEGTTKQRAGKTMRVAEKKVDIFMRYVGELIISSEAFRHLERELRTSDVPRSTQRRFARVLDGFDALSAELQKSILDIRQVPAGGLLRRVPRLARDVAASLGKEVEVELLGAELMMDKSIVEALDAPLTHMLRNALDHGFETPEERAAAGKSPAGQLRVAARQAGEAIEIVIADDGRGINTDALKKKAVEAGTLSAEMAASLSHEEALGLIFRSGMSTAEKVTDLSGRGVGMDVVQAHLAELGGAIRIKSELGSGTELVLSLPADFTRVVLQCLVVRTSGDILCIPIEEVDGIHHYQHPRAHHQAFGEFISVRGKEHLVVRVNELLHGPQAERRELNDGVHIQIVDGHSRATLFVDEVIGQQKVVVREMPPISLEAELFNGVALFGSGSLGLVLAPRAAVRAARVEPVSRAA